MTVAKTTGILVSDYDGTLTLHDFFEIACTELVPPGTPDYWGEFLAGQWTVFEVLERIFASIRADEATVLDAARRCVIDPEAGPLIRQLQQAGWEVQIASAGCHWYIDRLLAEREIEIEVFANPGEFRPGEGLVLQRNIGAPHYAPATGIDKAGVVRAALERCERVAFAGDGAPDFAAASLVPESRRFARATLARKLTAAGMGFRPFERWAEVAEALLLEFTL